MGKTLPPLEKCTAHCYFSKRMHEKIQKVHGCTFFECPRPLEPAAELPLALGALWCTTYHASSKMNSEENARFWFSVKYTYRYRKNVNRLASLYLQIHIHFVQSFKFLKRIYCNFCEKICSIFRVINLRGIKKGHEERKL